MLLLSIFTLPLGLTEPLFVPNYWNPPSLFNLAKNTGFDIESLIFAFSIGGIGSVLYNIIFKVGLGSLTKSEVRQPRHKWHELVLISPIIIFSLLALFSHLNHIYCIIIAMFSGTIASIYCRPDLIKKTLIGGLLFLIIYFIYFLSLVLVFPSFVENTWNLSALSGILIFKIPLEELLFAFTFGMYWASLYEHYSWKKIIGCKK